MIFLIMGTIICAMASIVGLALACVASFVLDHYQLISLPDVYYTTHLPSHMEWYMPPFVFAVVMLISVLATWIPTRQIASINIADVLRFEG